MNEKFMNWKEFEEVECKDTDIEYHGMSGQYYGYHWYSVVDNETNEEYEIFVYDNEKGEL